MLGVVTVVAAFALLGLVDLPGLFGKQDRRGELMAASAILGVGMALMILSALGVRFPSVWQGIALITRPVGAFLFHLAGE